MKRIIFVIILIFCMLSLASCVTETAGNTVFQAEVLEIRNGYILVEPLEGSMEANSSDRIEVSMKNMESSPEPEVGDIIEITYNGDIAESYPAQILEVYDIKVVKEAEKWDLIPMVMIDSKIYLDSGRESTKTERVDGFDGEISSEVDGSERPSVNDQSNFGTGYGYQYGKDDTIEIYINGKWWVFEAEQ